MKRFLAIGALILASAASSSHAALRFPVDQYLIHIFGPWQYPPTELESQSRTARATILFFGSNGQYVEHHAYIIDNRNGLLNISVGDGHTVSVGNWSRKGSEISAVRKRVARVVRVMGPGPDPLCNPPLVTYQLDAKGVRNQKRVLFRPIKKLDPQDWQGYVSEAETSPIICEVANTSLQPTPPKNGGAAELDR